MLQSFQRPRDFYYLPVTGQWFYFLCAVNPPHLLDQCKYNFLLLHIGQDEAIFKQNSLPAYYWSVKGKVELRPKTEGQGIMTSVFVNEWNGRLRISIR